MSTCFYGLGSPEILEYNLTPGNYTGLKNFRCIGIGRMDELASYLTHRKPDVAGRLRLFDTETGRLLPRAQQPKTPFFKGWRDENGKGLLEKDAVELGSWLVYETRTGRKPRLQFQNHAIFSTFKSVRKRHLDHANSEEFSLQENVEEWIPNPKDLRSIGKWMIQSGGFFMA